MDGLPVALSDPSCPLNIPELLVVDASNARGMKIWVAANKDGKKKLHHVYATRQDIKCPDDRRENSYRHATGTSLGMPEHCIV